jgi:hypothetical protein
MTMHDELPPVPATDAPTEPLIAVGGLTALAAAFIALIVSFGFNISNDQQSAILAILAVAVPLFTAAWGRMRVFAPATVAKLVAQARRPSA